MTKHEAIDIVAKAIISIGAIGALILLVTK